MNSSEPTPHVVVRLKTSYYQTQAGLSKRKDLIFLKRKCKGYNFLEEDIKQIGADLVLQSFTNFDSVEDGVYQVVMVNVRTDYWTGHADLWDYELIPEL